MVIVFNALRLRTLGRFAAPDPWNANRPSEFSIEEYVMMPQGSKQAIDSSQYAHRIGLRSEADGSQHMLPESLVELWRLGQIPPERIPVLAQAIQPRVLKEDLNLILNQAPMKTIVIPLVAVLVIVTGILLFVPVEDEHLTPLVAVAFGGGFTLMVGAVLWVVRQSGRRRRAEQMQWLLAVHSGADGAGVRLPEGKLKNRVKMFIKLYAMILGFFLLIGGGAALWYNMGGQFVHGGSPREPEVTSATGDIQVPFELLASQVSTGITALIDVPVTGEHLTVKIPPGVADGTRLRLRGQGAPASNGARGDLYVKVRIRH